MNAICIQSSAITGNTRDVYEGIQRDIVSTQAKTAPLQSATGETITDKAKQMDRWVKYFSELYSEESSISDTAFETIESPNLHDRAGRTTTMEEMNKAIQSAQWEVHRT